LQTPQLDGHTRGGFALGGVEYVGAELGRHESMR
jgi:hypothetical protein